MACAAYCHSSASFEKGCGAIALPTLQADRLVALAQIAEVDLEWEKVVNSHNVWKSH